MSKCRGIHIYFENHDFTGEIAVSLCAQLDPIIEARGRSNARRCVCYTVSEADCAHVVPALNRAILRIVHAVAAYPVDPDSELVHGRIQVYESSYSCPCSTGGIPADSWRPSLQNTGSKIDILTDFSSGVRQITANLKLRAAMSRSRRSQESTSR